MKARGGTMKTRQWLTAAALAFAALAASIAPIAAAVAAEDFAVRDVWFVRVGAGYAVRAELSVREAGRLDSLLRGGYQVPLRFELNFIEKREWWLDRIVGDITWRGLISYDALLNRYALQVGARRNFYSSLDRLLKRVGNLRGAASAAPAYVKIFEQKNIYVEARLLLEEQSFPEPIRIALLLDDNWDATGVWRTFQLQVRE